MQPEYIVGHLRVESGVFTFRFHAAGTGRSQKSVSTTSDRGEELVAQPDVFFLDPSQGDNNKA